MNVVVRRLTARTQKAGALFWQPAANKVYHFQAVAGFQRCLGPVVPGEDLPVELHGDTVSRKPQRLDQG
jgi:hypothetical protein